MPNQCTIIPLSRGKFAIIDAEDAERVLRFQWYANRNNGVWYAMRTERDEDGTQRTVRMHRYILDAPLGIEVDHCDGNGLNNTRGNLRLVTQVEQATNRGRRHDNTSGHPGVCWNALERRWKARINHHGRRINLGTFATFADALHARKVAERKYHGRFSRFAPLE